MTTVQFARDLPLAGTVRNLDDGGVELFVEGSAAAMNTLLARLREHFGPLIRNINEAISQPQNLPKGIQVLY